MILPDLILKSKRKSLSLCIMKDGRVIVRAPIKASNNDIEKFVYEKQNWLSDKLSIIRNNQVNFSDILSYNKFLYLGQRCTLKYDNCKKIQLGDDFKILIPNKIDKQKLLKSLKVWYIKQAKEIIINRSNEISSKLKLYPSDIKITGYKGRWGACNSKNVISYNWRLIMLEPNIIDYVIIHELCHMIEFNHSKRFWELVCAFMPTAKTTRLKMKDYSFLLEMFNK